MEEEPVGEILLRVERRGGRTLLSGSLFSEFARSGGAVPLDASEYVVETLNAILADKLDRHTKRMRKELEALRQHVADLHACAVSRELLDIMEGALEQKTAVVEARMRILVSEMVEERLARKKKRRIRMRRK